MQSAGVVVSAVFASAFYSLWGRGGTCICECSGVAGADERVLTILRDQLERCGPENLVHSQVPASGIVCVALFAFCLGLLARDCGARLWTRRRVKEERVETPIVAERTLAVTPSSRRA